MTLRLKLFVLIGGLLALMVGAEWLLIETLTKDLRVEVKAVATSVGKDIVRILHPAHEKGPGLPAPHAPANEDEPAKRIVVTTVQTTGDGAISSTKSWTTAGGTGFLFIEGPDARARVRIPETGVKDAVTRFRTRLVLGSLGIVAVGLLAAAFVAHRVARPLVELSRAARTLGEGGFGAHVSTREGGEVGEAIAAFNQMSSRARGPRARGARPEGARAPRRDGRGRSRHGARPAQPAPRRRPLGGRARGPPPGRPRSGRDGGRRPPPDRGSRRDDPVLSRAGGRGRNGGERRRAGARRGSRPLRTPGRAAGSAWPSKRERPGHGSARWCPSCAPRSTRSS
ncbi:MAG: HAMP domain-containing protein [Holophagales bacterium]|nr:HAMP domain-containing protein [Holophagales bacterium]